MTLETSTKNLSAVYAEYINKERFENLSDAVVQQAKLRVLDTVGVALGGYSMMDFPKIVVDFVLDMGGKPEATVFQTGKKVPAINAALANGACAHALDMDDGHRYSALHPAVAVLPAALAAAEMTGAGTKELITGIVVGYEIMIRIGMAINPSSLKRGFHTTGVCAATGAAADTASIMKLTKEEIIGSLGLSGLQASGLLVVNHDDEGAKVKPINPARAAVSGLLSSIFAKKGANGPGIIFEGEDGFLGAFADDVRTEQLVDGLGKDYEILNAYDKLYSACRHAHPAMDAALEACRQNSIAIDDISKIVIETYPAALRLAGIPRPTTPSAARFSTAFSVALLLILHDASADKYSEENVRDEKIQSLTSLVELKNGGKWDKLYPAQRGATVTITDRMDRNYTVEIGLAKGEPENPASSDDMYNKFLANATMQISESQAKKLAEVILDLDNHGLDDFVSMI